MSETTSGTTSFVLPVDEIIQEALDMIGGEHTSAYESQSARRSLNMLLIDLTNGDTPLNFLRQATISVVAGTATYTLPADVVDMITMVAKQDGQTTDYTLSSESVLDFIDYPDKTQTGKPSIYVFDRTKQPRTVTLWPIPTENYTVSYWCVRRNQDVSASYQLADITYRYTPVLTFGLAWMMSHKREGIPPQRREELKMQYNEFRQRALDEDTDTQMIKVFPYLRTT